MGRVGNCPPIFGQLSDAAAVAEAQSISTCQPSFRKLLTPLTTYSAIKMIILLNNGSKFNIQSIVGGIQLGKYISYTLETIQKYRKICFIFNNYVVSMM